MRIEVDRSKWLRGETAGPSFLLRQEDGKMCCFGFAMRACGFAADRISYVRSPQWITLTPGEKAEKILDEFLDKEINQFWVRNAMSINDSQSPALDGKEREVRLIDLFKEGGHELVFV